MLDCPKFTYTGGDVQNYIVHLHIDLMNLKETTKTLNSFVMKSHWIIYSFTKATIYNKK